MIEVEYLQKIYVQPLDKRQLKNPETIKNYHPIRTVLLRQSQILAASVHTYDMLYFTDTHNSRFEHPSKEIDMVIEL